MVNISKFNTRAKHKKLVELSIHFWPGPVALPCDHEGGR